MGINGSNTDESNRLKSRLAMRRYNATPKGAAYNRKHVKEWRKKFKKPHGRRKNRQFEFREAIVYFIIERDGLNCYYCKLSLQDDKFHIAHKLACSLGGQHRLNNYVLAHAKCNQEDGIVVHKKVVCK